MKKIALFLMLFCASITISFAQPAAVDSRISEVYGTYTSQLSVEQLQWLENVLNRCEIVEQTATQVADLPLLSGVPMVEKFGSQDPALPADPQQVNPLKYMIKFNKTEINQYFRIDGTNYVLVVHKLD